MSLALLLSRERNVFSLKLFCVGLGWVDVLTLIENYGFSLSLLVMIMVSGMQGIKYLELFKFCKIIRVMNS